MRRALAAGARLLEMRFLIVLQPFVLAPEAVVVVVVVLVALAAVVGAGNVPVGCCFGVVADVVIVGVIVRVCLASAALQVLLLTTVSAPIPCSSSAECVELVRLVLLVWLGVPLLRMLPLLPMWPVSMMPLCGGSSGCAANRVSACNKK